MGEVTHTPSLSVGVVFISCSADKSLPRIERIQFMCEYHSLRRWLSQSNEKYEPANAKYSFKMARLAGPFRENPELSVYVTHNAG